MEGSEYRFFCDRMLGKLARKLRLLGFDTLYYPEIDEDDIFNISRGRILLTRDKEVYRKAFSKGIEAYYIEHDDWRAQLRKLFLDLKLYNVMKPFTRCVECNEPLVDAKPDDVKGKVPEYVYKTVENFKICPKCGKVYWKGSHLDWIKRDMEKLVGEWRTE